ncbi:MAG: hypothetical protein KC713_04635 [Candidatus Omnitrophica bacterium]|nr:hypothetical protein [Candidatus Omnitrophota bacterium]
MKNHSGGTAYFQRWNNQRGSMLLFSYYTFIILAGLGSAFVITAFNESRLAERQRKMTAALSSAEAGIERAIYDLRLDCNNNPTNPDWSDGDINGMSVGPDTNAYYNVDDYNGNTINGGSYAVRLKNVSGKNTDIWIQSTGTEGPVSQTITTYVKGTPMSPWHTAIFGGDGSSGEVVSGVGDIRGTVHLLGTSLADDEFAMELGGAAHAVMNNYSGLASNVTDKVPGLDTEVYDGESVSTLSSQVWVKNGLVGLIGNGTLGTVHVKGNSVKETLDAVYVEDGFAGSMGPANVYSDNGVNYGYNLGDSITFPGTADAYGIYPDYENYLTNNAYVITNSVQLTQLANITPLSNFAYIDSVNGRGGISMDGAGNLTADGIVYINGGDFNIAASGGNTTINYTGEGLIYSSGNIQINANLLTTGNSSFPDNVIAFVTANDISFNYAGADIMGLFYGESSIRMDSQVDIMGTVVSHYIDLGTHEPSVNQVPQTTENLPTGLIGSQVSCYMEIVSWQKQ